jgi:hypothetical protein
MKQKGVIVLMFDQPTTADFIEWVHGPHMQDMAGVPGITRIRRYEVLDGPPDRRGWVAVIETDDLQATMDYRNSEDGQRPQRESTERGVANRYGLFCREIFVKTFGSREAHASIATTRP